MRNKYIKRTHFSEQKFRTILRLFYTDLTAVQISNLTVVNRSFDVVNASIKSKLIDIEYSSK